MEVDKGSTPCLKLDLGVWRYGAPSVNDLGYCGHGPSVAAPPDPPATLAIPSWHARSGRLTVRKRWALDELAARFALGPQDPQLTRFEAIALEIGAGTGEAALALAASRPDLLVIAAEVHKASLARLLLDLEQTGAANVRVVNGDGRAVLAAQRGGQQLQLVRVFFPDPWPKRHHHNRRLIDAKFVELVADVLAPDGVLELATDDERYGAVMRCLLGETPQLDLLAEGGRADRPLTYYERRAIEAGRPVLDLRYRRRAQLAPPAGVVPCS